MSKFAKVFTASPSEREPVATPMPDLIVQYAGVVAGALMRPPCKDGKDMSASEYKAAMAEIEATYKKDLEDWKSRGSPKPSRPILKNPFHEDTWQASGCHPACTTMLVNWLLRNGTTSAGLTFPSKKSVTPPITPLTMAGELFDGAGGSPGQRSFASHSDHPPWVPRRLVGKVWNVDHAAVSAGPKKLSRGGKNAQLNTLLFKLVPPKTGSSDDLERERLQKRVKIKEALMHGPVAVNINTPGHVFHLGRVRDAGAGTRGREVRPRALHGTKQRQVQGRLFASARADAFQSVHVSFRRHWRTRSVAKQPGVRAVTRSTQGACVRNR